MPRYSVGTLGSAAGTTLPTMSVYSAAASGFRFREGGVFLAGGSTNTTWRAIRLTSQGTPGAALIEAPHSPDAPAAACTAFDAHTGAPSLGDDIRFPWVTAPAVGSGSILRALAPGIRCDSGTNNGIGMLKIGSSSTVDAYMVWDE